MNEQQFDILLLDYVEGALPDDVAEEMRLYAETHPEAEAMLASLKLDMVWAQAALEPVEPPSSLNLSILQAAQQALDASAPAMPVVEEEEVPQGWFARLFAMPGFQPALGFATVLLVVGAVFFVNRGKNMMSNFDMTAKKTTPKGLPAGAPLPRSAQKARAREQSSVSNTVTTKAPAKRSAESPLDRSGSALVPRKEPPTGRVAQDPRLSAENDDDDDDDEQETRKAKPKKRKAKVRRRRKRRRTRNSRRYRRTFRSRRSTRKGKKRRRRRPRRYRKRPLPRRRTMGAGVGRRQGGGRGYGPARRWARDTNTNAYDKGRNDGLNARKAEKKKALGGTKEAAAQTGGDNSRVPSGGYVPARRPAPAKRVAPAPQPRPSPVAPPPPTARPSVRFNDYPGNNAPVRRADIKGGSANKPSPPKPNVDSTTAKKQKRENELNQLLQRRLQQMRKSAKQSKSAVPQLAKRSRGSYGYKTNQLRLNLRRLRSAYTSKSKNRIRMYSLRVATNYLQLKRPASAERYFGTYISTFSSNQKTQAYRTVAKIYSRYGYSRYSWRYMQRSRNLPR